jgi:hypothetical protein
MTIALLVFIAVCAVYLVIAQIITANRVQKCKDRIKLITRELINIEMSVRSSSFVTKHIISTWYKNNKKDNK